MHACYKMDSIDIGFAEERRPQDIGIVYLDFFYKKNMLATEARSRGRGVWVMEERGKAQLHYFPQP